MSDYSFHTLNDREFEVCAIELIAEHLGKRIERFKPGKDQGVDGRFFSAPNEETIIQCKHWPRTPFKTLLNALQREELPKVKKLLPSRYILALSNELSRQAKKQIAAIFHPFLHESDIYGREDINDILRKNPTIEQRHYKLWLSSTPVLQAIINAGVRGRSEFRNGLWNNSCSVGQHQESVG